MTADSDPDLGAGLGAPVRRGSLLRVILEGEAPARLSPLMQADRDTAVADLEAENCFVLADRPGPYVLRLSVQQGRLVFDVRDGAGTALRTLGLALGPFRGLFKDYELLVASYGLAVEEGREDRLQAIDMGRRGLHNEGAELLRQRLAGRIAVDLATARRLFTLICALHQRI